MEEIEQRLRDLSRMAEHLTLVVRAFRVKYELALMAGLRAGLSPEEADQRLAPITAPVAILFAPLPQAMMATSREPVEGAGAAPTAA